MAASKKNRNAGFDKLYGGKAKKPKAKKVDVQIQTVFMVPPLKHVEQCPRCGGAHKIKAKKLLKPFRVEFNPPAEGEKPLDPIVSSFWAMCPKTKEPIILFDHYVTTEDILKRNIVKDLASQIDKDVINSINASMDKETIDSLKGIPSAMTISYDGPLPGEKPKKGKGKGKKGIVATAVWSYNAAYTLPVDEKAEAKFEKTLAKQKAAKPQIKTKLKSP